MRIAFVSTILHYPWGGADALWTSAAEMALTRGDQVFMAVSALTARHERIAALRAGGAEAFIRPTPEEAGALWRRAWRKGPWAARHPHRLRDQVRAFRPDLVVISCGGTYDPILEPALMAWLRESGTRFRLVANFQEEHPPLDESGRQSARAALLAAERIFCVSPRNLELDAAPAAGAPAQRRDDPRLHGLQSRGARGRAGLAGAAPGPSPALRGSNPSRAWTCSSTPSPRPWAGSPTGA